MTVVGTGKGQGVVPPPWLHVAAGSSARLAEPPLRPWRVFCQLVAGALVVISLVALVGGVASRRLGEADSVSDAARTANLLAVTAAQPAVSEALLVSDPSAVAAMDKVVRERVLSPSIVRVKIWDPQGRILYSDAAALIGQRFLLGQEEQNLLAQPLLRLGADTRADVSDLTAPENRLERGQGRLLEVYRPIRTPSGKPLLFEIYAPYGQVAVRTGQLWGGLAGVTLISLLLLVALMLPVLWTLLNRLSRSQAQREALLRHANDASTQERRRLAGAIDDSVVQDLVGASFAVAAGAERARTLGGPELADQLRAAAGTVRTSIGGLRSLLVDVYPASLATAGLRAALTDLASSLRSRGTAVTLDLDPETGLDAAGERLVFRVARECLANVAKHAAATTVLVSLKRTDRLLLLAIMDDGVGFDAAGLLADPTQDHVGLGVLRDVVADSGSELLLSSRPGAGTRWQLAIPLA